MALPAGWQHPPHRTVSTLTTLYHTQPPELPFAEKPHSCSTPRIAPEQAGSGQSYQPSADAGWHCLMQGQGARTFIPSTAVFTSADISFCSVSCIHTWLTCVRIHSDMRLPPTRIACEQRCMARPCARQRHARHFLASPMRVPVVPRARCVLATAASGGKQTTIQRRHAHTRHVLQQTSSLWYMRIPHTMGHSIHT